MAAPLRLRLRLCKRHRHGLRFCEAGVSVGCHGQEKMQCGGGGRVDRQVSMQDYINSEVLGEAQAIRRGLHNKLLALSKDALLRDQRRMQQDAAELRNRVHLHQAILCAQQRNSTHSPWQPGPQHSMAFDSAKLQRREKINPSLTCSMGVCHGRPGASWSGRSYFTLPVVPSYCPSRPLAVLRRFDFAADFAVFISWR